MMLDMGGQFRDGNTSQTAVNLGTLEAAIQGVGEHGAQTQAHTARTY
jgi:hypothetical protein